MYCWIWHVRTWTCWLPSDLNFLCFLNDTGCLIIHNCESLLLNQGSNKSLILQRVMPLIGLKKNSCTELSKSQYFQGIFYSSTKLVDRCRKRLRPDLSSSISCLPVVFKWPTRLRGLKLQKVARAVNRKAAWNITEEGQWHTREVHLWLCVWVQISRHTLAALPDLHWMNWCCCGVVLSWSPQTYAPRRPRREFPWLCLPKFATIQAWAHLFFWTKCNCVTKQTPRN
jgi:hypothetical protein